MSCVAACLLAACFRTRPVEPPDNLGSSWQPPTSGEMLVGNFVSAIQSLNIQNYQRCFSEGNGYRFVPSPALLNGHENVWQNWSKNDEQTYLTNVKSRLLSGSAPQFQLSNPVVQNLSADSMNYTAGYSIFLPFQDTSKQRRFVGQVSLVLKLNTNANVWEIHRWTDIAAQADSSWSKLKLVYSQ